MKCPICDQLCKFLCDNDCGTISCINDHEYYETVEGKMVPGHNPECEEAAEVDDTLTD